MSSLGAAASRSAPLKPDPQLTPGATLEVTTSDLCVPGYTKKVHAVPAAITRQVYDAVAALDHTLMMP